MSSEQIDLSGRPPPPVKGLRRQPTKYPHGLCVNIQSLSSDDERSVNYSRASTLRQSPNNDNNQPSGKYQLNGNANDSDNLTHLQVQPYKYPLTDNYSKTSHAQSDISKSSLLILDYAKDYCKWKCLRWPLIFFASVLIFFGLITYCIWLHDVSVARERYLQFRQHFADTTKSDNLSITTSTDATDSLTNPTTENRNHGLRESTILRAIGTRARNSPREQKLTTVDYSHTKGAGDWIKHQPGDEETFVESTTLISEEAALAPVNVIRFTSGHQNSFGVPIEDDERILRLLNGLFSSNEPSTIPTKAAMVKVSPTIPPLKRDKSTDPTVPLTKSYIQDNRCYSTSLEMCQGVLDYDLTYNTSYQLTESELQDYQSLVQSNCSVRAIEFICAVLQPECRPSHIGVLPPCRRICKAVLEACSEIIANSDTLTATFDCSLYPDSNDFLRCEDSTRRRGYCYANEFECYDRSCIPLQWQCDNIKDCAAGEDESECLICDQPDEFRCRSNEKCIPGSARCNLSYDCFDGSDEDDCSGYDANNSQGLEFDEADLNSFPRVFSYASFLSPNQTNNNFTYFTAHMDDESVNFRDSKEIMMTSDTENKFKYSSTNTNRSSSKYSANTTPLKPLNTRTLAAISTTETTKAPSTSCGLHHLRCVSGQCITVDQLCDKKKDCPDGFDELMCIYKDNAEVTTTKKYNNFMLATSIATSTSSSNLANNNNNNNTSNNNNNNTLRNDKRTIRTTTIKRKLKT
uniref:FZ domain-containing protein n=1 Tax=Glossina pallidipes TaxID=7398 RepID=A0A1A9ZD22_GLOPL